MFDAKLTEAKGANLVLAKQLEDEKKARVEIEARVAWRRLTDTQKHEIASRLRQFSGVTGGFWFNAGDSEGALFASDIFEAFAYADLARLSPSSKLDFGAPARAGNIAIPSGVIIASTADKPSEDAANVLIHLLATFGFDCKKSEQIDKRATSMVIVTVESRPQGPQGDAKLIRGHSSGTAQ